MFDWSAFLVQPLNARFDAAIQSRLDTLPASDVAAWCNRQSQAHEAACKAGFERFRHGWHTDAINPNLLIMMRFWEDATLGLRIAESVRFRADGNTLLVSRQITPAEGLAKHYRDTMAEAWFLGEDPLGEYGYGLFFTPLPAGNPQ